MSKKYPLLDDKEWLEKKYLGERLSALKIAEILGCGRTTVYRALKHFGIPIRTISEARLGHHPSEDHKRKISDANKGKKRTEETRRKISEANARREITEETRRKMSESLKGRKAWNKDKRPTEETRRKMRENHADVRGEKNPMFGTHPSEETKKKMRKPHKISEESKQKMREARKHRKPLKHHTKPERIFEEICKRYNLPFKYTGDSSFWIGKNPAINPDFIHLTKKIAVEIFSYWHDTLKRHCKVPYSQTYEGRKKILKKYGWKMIVFWQDDLEQEDAEKHILRALKEEKVI